MLLLIYSLLYISFVLGKQYKCKFKSMDQAYGILPSATSESLSSSIAAEAVASSSVEYILPSMTSTDVASETTTAAVYETNTDTSNDQSNTDYSTMGSSIDDNQTTKSTSSSVASYNKPSYKSKSKSKDKSNDKSNDKFNDKSNDKSKDKSKDKTSKKATNDGKKTSDPQEPKKFIPYLSVFRQKSNFKTASFNGKSVFTPHESQIHASSSTGSKDGDGSKEKPYDLQTALDTVSNGGQINLLNGDVFSGNFECKKDNVAITSYGDGDKPILTRSIKLGDDLKTETELNRNKVLKYDVSSVVKGDTVWAVWVNGFRYTTARFPNLKDPKIKYGQDEGEFIALKQPTNGRTNKLFVNQDLSKFAHWKGATIRLRETNWNYARARIESVNQQDNSLTLNLAIKSSEFATSFFVENIQRDLDAPSEFYYDSKSKSLYIYMCDECPKTDNPYDQGVWILAHSESLCDNSPWIRNINDDHLVKTKNGLLKDSVLSISSNGVTVNDVLFTRGFVGIEMFGSDVTIQNSVFNEFLHTGIMSDKDGSGAINSCAISACDIFGVYSVAKSVSMSDLTITDTGLIAGVAYQGSGIYCANCQVTKSKVFRSGYAGIFTRQNSVVEDNDIKDWAMTMADTGAFYASEFFSNNVKVRNNRISGKNYVNTLSTRSPLGRGSGSAFYYDQDSFNIEITDNTVTANTAFCIRVNSAKNVVFSGNSCTNSGVLFHNSDDKTTLSAISITKNTFTMDERSNSNRILDYYFIDRNLGLTVFKGISDNTFTVSHCKDQGFQKMDRIGKDIRISLEVKNRYKCF